MDDMEMGEMCARYEILIEHLREIVADEECPETGSLWMLGVHRGRVELAEHLLRLCGERKQEFESCVYKSKS